MANYYKKDTFYNCNDDCIPKNIGLIWPKQLINQYSQ